MAGEPIQLTPPYPGTSPKGRGGRIDPATGLLIPDDGGEGTVPPGSDFKWPEGFDPTKPPDMLTTVQEQTYDPTMPVLDPVTGQYKMGGYRNQARQVENPAYREWFAIYNRAIEQAHATGKDQLARQLAIDLQTLKGTQQTAEQEQAFKNTQQLHMQENTFTAGQTQLQREARAQETAQGQAFDWTKLQAQQTFTQHMQQATQQFDLQKVQMQEQWQATQNDMNRAIENRRVAIESGHLDEAVRHNRVTEQLAFQSEIQKSKMENINMIQGILKDPAVFMMMRMGGFSFGQISPEYQHLDSIPVPTENTAQNLARWQAGSQFAKQAVLPGFGHLRSEFPGSRQVGPIPTQLTQGQVYPNIPFNAAGVPVWSPGPGQTPSSPIPSNTPPPGSQAVY